MTEGPARDAASDAAPRAARQGAADAVDRDAASGHDQPTRPAYGHLYGVERSLDSFLPLQDVVFAVDEAFLEALRDFAAHALGEMRRLGGDYDHLHFRDVAQVWHESWPDIVLVAPRPPTEAGAQASPDEADHDHDPDSAVDPASSFDPDRDPDPDPDPDPDHAPDRAPAPDR